MKIALAQIEVVPGRPDINVARMKKECLKAKLSGADVVAYPEMCIGGYLIGDRWLEDGYCRNLMEWGDKFIHSDEAKDIAVIFGNVYLDERGSYTHLTGEDGRKRRYNAAYAFKNGRPLNRMFSRDKAKSVQPKGVQIKTLLPNYRFFDDKRYFIGLQTAFFQSNNIESDLRFEYQPFVIYEEYEGKIDPRKRKEIGSIGIEICEDIWCQDYQKNNDIINVTDRLMRWGPDVIVNISASPWTHGKNIARDHAVKRVIVDIQLKDPNPSLSPICYVNCTGVQNNGKNMITFDGGSTIYTKDGNPAVLTNTDFEEETILFDTEVELTKVKRAKLKAVEEKRTAIIYTLRRFNNFSGRKGLAKFIIGLSGGADSTLSALLCVDAVGKENVIGVNMPTQYNSKNTIGVFERLSKALMIENYSIPIEGVVREVTTTIESNTDISITEGTLVDENIAAKTRATMILSTVAQAKDGVFTNNGNKLEIATGYATLYGDWGGALAIIGDLTKVEVFAMLRMYINERPELKAAKLDVLLPDKNYQFDDEDPEAVFPTAELKYNQKDPIKFGYHDAILNRILDYRRTTIEDVLRWHINGKLAKELQVSHELLEVYGIDDGQTFIDDLRWLTSRIENSVFKRVQAPPIIILSKTAFGYDYRESILPAIVWSSKAEDLCEKILKKQLITK